MAHIRLTGKGKHVFLLILPQYLKQCFIIHYKIHVQSKILEKLYLGFYVATGDIGEPSNTSKSMNCDMFVLPFYYGIGLPALGSVSSFPHRQVGYEIFFKEFLSWCSGNESD